MKKSLVVLALVGMVLLIASTSFAATSYVVTNDDNCGAASNTSSIYTLNTSTGALKLFKTLNTGGLGNCGGFFATVGNAISQDAKCLYVADGGTSDIAAFTVPALTKVGNYSNAALNNVFPGGSMAMSPNGKFLYATYGGSANIGAWKRNADCSLTFIAAYTASFGVDTYSNIIVDPSGKGVVVSVDDLGGLELFLINQTSGALTDLGSTNLNNTSCASIDGCFPTGLDISKGELLVAGNATFGASAFTTQLVAKSPYFTKVTYVDLTSSGLCNIEVPWLSAAAYKTGSGALYFGASGFGIGSGCQSGVETTNLSGGAVTTVKSNSITGPVGYDGIIQSSGTWMVVSEWFNTLQVFKINADGSLTASSQGPVTDANANGALSFFIYPQTR
jgi:hypothetical protein